jgi:hypothetical protein
MVLERRYYVYIMASMSRVIYVAMTGDEFEVITRIVIRKRPYCSRLYFELRFDRFSLGCVLADK